MSCCKKIFDFGRLSSGDGKLSLGQNATASGVYTLEADFLGVVLKVQAQIEIGAPIEFPVNALNESHVYIGRVYDPNGAQIQKDVDGVLYECFSFQTAIIYPVN